MGLSQNERRIFNVPESGELYTVKDRHRAEKIVSAIEAEVISKIIRPGPKPEERECTTVAREMKDNHSRLVDIILPILREKIN